MKKKNLNGGEHTGIGAQSYIQTDEATVVGDGLTNNNNHN